MTTTKTTSLLVALGAVILGGCTFDILNPNNPDPIGNDPSRAQVAGAVTGILISARGDAADWILDLGIMGREAYRFDAADPRFTSEMLYGGLDPGSAAFGGDHWFEWYRTIRSENNLLAVIGSASQLTPEERNGVIGFAKTMQALDFMRILATHTEDSIPIDVGTPSTSAPAPFATNAQAWARVNQLLADAQTALQGAGATFAFDMGAGFTGFSDPASFLKFNRAAAARADLYQGLYAQVLTDLGGSFIDPAASMDLGVYYDFSTGSGDQVNTLSQNPTTGENFVHPMLRDSAETQQASALLDARFLAKTTPRPSKTFDDLTSDIGWIRYPTPSSSIPIIRNEELLLIRAEAYAQTNDLANATADINTVRTVSGNLAPIGLLGSQAAGINQVLHERLYSLLYEGGHRWIDMVRLKGGVGIPIDRTGRPSLPDDQVYLTFPIPTAEVQAHE